MNISILGTGITQFGELWDKSLTDLLLEAKNLAVADARLEDTDIEAIYVANKAGGSFEGQLHLGAMVSSFFPQFPPAVRIEGACASGSLALVAAEQALLAGTYKTVLVIGAEKMTDVSVSRATEILAGAANREEEYGSTFPGLYALLAQIYRQKYGPIRAALTAVSVKNHRHGVNNPYAQFRKELTVEMIEQSPLVADPLRVLDCSPLSDGAAAVVLSTKKVAQKSQIIGVGHGMDSLTLAGRKTLPHLAATQRAAQVAFAQAGFTQKDIPVAEVHDCFTIAEVLATEDLGFFAPGKGAAAAVQGQTTVGGKLVINPSGGLKASGHPVGATGVKQVAYLAQLLNRGEFSAALAHNVGGSGATAVVHILKGAK